ncbi:Peptidoglycan O-acetyltransferase [Stieleria bergensis]|uniref:Peptidoglycan O-acetyltransferase n=1 Tax=Stieleria bergensis TaxID=2528025 RepID=A0A517SXM2_9BACT|nr:Peptidoglycan O-acetyltransferase [Planctomycetes bacterium SV_7m_r]
MNFNSTGFVLLAGLTICIYWLLGARNRTRAQNWLLIFTSYTFYATWDHRFLFLLILSTGIDFACGLGLAGVPLRRGKLLTLSVAGVVASLFLCGPWNWPALVQSAIPETLISASGVSVQSGFLHQDADWNVAILAAATVLVAACLLAIGTLVRSRRYFLCVSVVGNLSILGFFKYFDFFIETISESLHAIGFDIGASTLGLIVPVGISFYTFQTLSYSIDIYRRQLAPTGSLLDFAVFVAFFPQLVAGPIERASVLLPQIRKSRIFSWPQMQAGMFLIAFGLFKKIFIADNLAPLANAVYESDRVHSGPEILLATYAFAFQIYCDFSAYSDIARGVSRFLGIELMVNFNSPYVARNPQDFWRRWHISLSTWLRDYLYIPLGGSKAGTGRTSRNLALTMLLGGLWHGAAANFVLWGAYQGGLLGGHRSIRKPLEKWSSRQSVVARSIFAAISWTLFFHLMCYGWLLFRAKSMSQISVLTGSLFSGWASLPAEMNTGAKLAFYIAPLLLFEWAQVRTGNLLAPLHWHWSVRVALYVCCFYLTIIFGAFGESEFIYFQF